MKITNKKLMEKLTPKEAKEYAKKEALLLTEDYINKLKKQAKEIGGKDYPYAVVDIRKLESINEFRKKHHECNEYCDSDNCENPKEECTGCRTSGHTHFIPVCLPTKELPEKINPMSKVTLSEKVNEIIDFLSNKEETYRRAFNRGFEDGQATPKQECALCGTKDFTPKPECKILGISQGKWITSGCTPKEERCLCPLTIKHNVSYHYRPATKPEEKETSDLIDEYEDSKLRSDILEKSIREIEKLRKKKVGVWDRPVLNGLVQAKLVLQALKKENICKK